MKKNLFFLFLLLVLFISSCNTSDDVLSSEIFGRKSVDNYNTHSIELVGNDITKAPNLLWTDKNTRFSVFSNPVIINNHIFAGSNEEGLVKLVLNDAQILSSIPDLQIHQGQITYDKGVLYYASYEYLIAFDIKTDKILWNIDFGHALVSLPLITDKYIIIADDVEGIYALNKNDGKIKWFVEIVNGIDTRGGIAGDNSKIVFGGRDGYIICLDTETGNEKWIFKTCNDILSCPLVSTPTISNGKVYAGDYKGNIYAVDYSTGKQLWSKKYDGSIHWQNIAVNDKYLIITGQSASTILNANYIICLDKDTGNEIWGFKKDAVYSHEEISDPLIINKNYVLFATNDGTSLLDINSKKIIWTIDQNQGTVINQNRAVFGYAIANGRLVYVTRGGNLACYGLK